VSLDPTKSSAPASLYYETAKTKANKFVEKMADVTGTPKSIPARDSFDNTKSHPPVSKPNITDKLEFNVRKLETQENIEKAVEISFPTPKTTAHKFVQQFGTVVEKPDTNAKKVEVSHRMDNLIKNPELRSKMQEKLIKAINNSEFLSDKTEVIISNVANSILAEMVDELIKNADLAEAMLDLSFSPDIKLDLALINKFKEILGELDKALKEVIELQAKKKKESKVDIPIKRFDIRDILPRNIKDNI
jgi:hypothetical protein